MSSLVKKLDRCQSDLEVVKAREKLLRDEYEKLKLVMGKEKEMLRSKVLEFQQKLQQTEQTGATTEAFVTQIRRLEAEKQELEANASTMSDKCAQMETRMHLQEEMTNRFIQEKLDVERTRDQCASELATKNEQLASQQARIDELSALSIRGQEVDVLLLQHQRDFDHALLVKESEIDTLMHKTVNQERAIDELNASLEKRDAELDRLRSEVQRFQQLSQDETVQALQLARLKAANYEALILVEDEKRVLQERAETLQSQIERDASRFEELRASLEDKLATTESRIQDLLEENRTLHEKAAEQPAPPVVVEVEKVVVEASESALIDPAERARLAAEMEQLQLDYEELKENLHSVEAEYRKLAAKKYKTESFQSQVRLLQNENSELTLKLEQVCADLAELQERVSNQSACS